MVKFKKRAMVSETKYARTRAMLRQETVRTALQMLCWHT